MTHNLNHTAAEDAAWLQGLWNRLGRCVMYCDGGESPGVVELLDEGWYLTFDEDTFDHVYLGVEESEAERELWREAERQCE
jgi:hypothetical protein